MPSKRYRGTAKFYHMPSDPSYVESILKNGLMVKYARMPYFRKEGSRSDNHIYLSKDRPFWWRWWRDDWQTPPLSPLYRIVFEVDVRGIRDYELRWGSMIVFEDIPPERIRLLSCQEVDDLIQKNSTT